VKYLRNHPTFPGIAQEVVGPDAPKSVVLDAGATPVSEFTATVTDAAISATSIVLAVIASLAPGKDADEVAMDSYRVDVIPAAGSMAVTVRGLEGYIADKFTLNYTAG
jgi:hypothetical protein